MPPKSAKAKPAAKPAAKSAKPAAKSVKKPSAAPRQESKSAKPHAPIVNELLARRNKLLEKASSEESKEKVHMSVKGLYKCAKEENKKCLDEIDGNLKKLGGKKRA